MKEIIKEGKKEIKRFECNECGATIDTDDYFIDPDTRFWSALSNEKEYWIKCDCDNNISIFK